MAKWGLIKFGAGMETLTSSCRFGWKGLPPTCHHLFLRVQVPQMFISALIWYLSPVVSPQLQQPHLCQALGCALFFQVGSHFHVAWRKSLGFWVRWGFRVFFCISKASAPSIPWPRTGPVSILGQEPGPGSVWPHP